MKRKRKWIVSTLLFLGATTSAFKSLNTEQGYQLTAWYENLDGMCAFAPTDQGMCVIASGIECSVTINSQSYCPVYSTRASCSVQINILTWQN